MRFTLWQLYKMNKSKPYVEVTGIDDEMELQWDYCDMEGLPPKRTGTTMTDHGRVSTVPYEELPKIFYAKSGGKYFIELFKIKNIFSNLFYWTYTCSYGK